MDFVHESHLWSECLTARVWAAALLDSSSSVILLSTALHLNPRHTSSRMVHRERNQGWRWHGIAHPQWVGSNHRTCGTWKQGRLWEEKRLSAQRNKESATWWRMARSPFIASITGRSTSLAERTIHVELIVCLALECFLVLFDVDKNNVDNANDFNCYFEPHMFPSTSLVGLVC